MAEAPTNENVVVDYRFNASSASDKKALTVSAGGLSVQHNGPNVSSAIHGPLLPNVGTHKWRLRMSGGNKDQGHFCWIMCGVSEVKDPTAAVNHRQCYGWSTQGWYYCGNFSDHTDNNSFSRFTATAIPEVELTLDSGQHKLTMRRLDNGQTHTIPNIPQNVYVYVCLIYEGNKVEFVPL